MNLSFVIIILVSLLPVKKYEIWSGADTIYIKGVLTAMDISFCQPLLIMLVHGQCVVTLKTLTLEKIRSDVTHAHRLH